MLKNKKLIIYIVVSIVVVALITAGTIFALRLVNDQNKKDTQDSSKSAPTKETADSLKEKAIEALENKDTDKAKSLFTEANEQYTELGDTDNIIDTEAQLLMLSNASTSADSSDEQ